MRQQGITFALRNGILLLLLLALFGLSAAPAFAQIPPGFTESGGTTVTQPDTTTNQGRIGPEGGGGSVTSQSDIPDGPAGAGGATGPGTPGFDPTAGSGSNFTDPGTNSTDANPDLIGISENFTSQNAAGANDPLPYVESPANVVDSFIYYGALRISGWVLRLGGALFDTAYESFVLKLGCWFVAGSNVCAGDTIGNGQVGGVVNELWEMVRDMFNIAFIFALIYIGIRTILFTEDSSTRRMLGLLIAAALLINFSLYIAKIIVDLANFTAVQLHQNMVGKVTGSYLLEPNVQDINVSIGFAENSIAGAFMTVLGYSSFFGTDPNDVGVGYIILFSLMLLVFSFILAFTFAYAGLMLLSRFIAIVFYLIFSPLMFLAWVVPQFASAGKKWWSGFLGYAFYAPIFIFLIYLTLYTLQAFAGASSSFANPDFSAGFATSNSPGMMNSFIFFAVAVGFVIASTKIADSIAKQSGAIGMTTANKWSKRVTTGAGAAAGAWAGGRIASSGLGRTGQWMEEKSNSRYVPGALGTHVRKAGENLQKKEIGGASSFKGRRDATSTHEKKRQDALSMNDLKASLSSGGAAAATALRNAPSSQVEKLAQSSEGQTLLSSNISHINSDQVKAIANSKDENISDVFKNQVNAAHGNNIVSALGGTPGNTTAPISDLRKASKDDLAALGTAPLKQPANAARITKKQLDGLEELARSGKIDSREVADIKRLRDSTAESIASGTPVAGGPTRDDLLNAGEGLADFSKETLKHLAPDISYADLRKIAGKADQNKLQTIRREIERLPQSQPPRIIHPTTGEPQDADRSTWSPENYRWDFLNRDAAGKELGIRT